MDSLPEEPIFDLVVTSPPYNIGKKGRFRGIYHIEKTTYPCQFPVGLIERLVLSMTNENELVFDPYAGASSSGVAAIVHNRRFWGCEVVDEYIKISQERLQESIDGMIQYRPYDQPIYDAKRSNLSKESEEWK